MTPGFHVIRNAPCCRLRSGAKTPSKALFDPPHFRVNFKSTENFVAMKRIFVSNLFCNPIAKSSNTDEFSVLSAIAVRSMNVFWNLVPSVVRHLIKPKRKLKHHSSCSWFSSTVAAETGDCNAPLMISFDFLLVCSSSTRVNRWQCASSGCSNNKPCDRGTKMAHGTVMRAN